MSYLVGYLLLVWIACSIGKAAWEPPIKEED